MTPRVRVVQVPRSRPADGEEARKQLVQLLVHLVDMARGATALEPTETATHAARAPDAGRS